MVERLDEILGVIADSSNVVYQSSSSVRWQAPEML